MDSEYRRMKRDVLPMIDKCLLSSDSTQPDDFCAYDNLLPDVDNISGSYSSPSDSCGNDFSVAEYHGQFIKKVSAGPKVSSTEELEALRAIKKILDENNQVDKYVLSSLKTQTDKLPRSGNPEKKIYLIKQAIVSFLKHAFAALTGANAEWSIQRTEEKIKRCCNR